MGLPISPAFVQKKSTIPPHLQKLMPETQKDEIVVGTGMVGSVMLGDTEITLPIVLTIYPLPFIICTDLQDDIQKLFNDSRVSQQTCVHGGTVCTQQKMICAEKKIEQFAAPDPCMAYECPFFTPGNGDSVISLVLKTTGLSDKLVSFAVTGTGQYADFFRDNMTMQQRVDAVSKIWDMNRATDVYSEKVQKNVRGLLGMLGMTQETQEPTKSETKSDE